ncbi:30S ribosomal protein S12 methylthiotransferase RimO, partial [Pseudomonas aeruginosa]
NHSCSICIIPSMRGKQVSRPVGDVRSEAGRLFKSGFKVLLVISQDTSAYGVDLMYRPVFWNGQPVQTRMRALCEAMSSMGLLDRLHFVSPFPNVDDVIPPFAAGKLLQH